jgi:hypothetical protein
LRKKVGFGKPQLFLHQRYRNVTHGFLRSDARQGVLLGSKLRTTTQSIDQKITQNIFPITRKELVSFNFGQS